MIEVIEVKNDKDLKDFLLFPFELYKDCDEWVPPITAEEKAVFDKEKNPVFQNADAQLFLAKRNGKVLGRIAALINWIEIKKQQKHKVRFGWYDVVNEIEVSKKLLEAVSDWGKAHNMRYMEGPMGFSNMDKAGLLTEGFEYKNTMITWYHYPYQKDHLEQLGYKKQAEWVEFQIKIFDQKDAPEKVKKFAKVIAERYQLKPLEFSSRKALLPYVDEMFDLLNKTYDKLQTFVPIQPHQVAHYKEKYFRYIHPDFIKCVADANGKLVAFAITMPSFSEALKKVNGKLFPLGFLHILKAQRINHKASFYLIGIDPDYQNKGVTAIIFQGMQDLFNKRGITDVETNPELEENSAIQKMWKNYDHKLHKRRRTYKKDL